MSPHLLRRHLPAVVWAALVSLLLLTPLSESADSSLVRWTVGLSSFWIDTAAHFLLFAVLGWLSVGSLRAAGARRPARLAILLAAAYGVALEVAQAFVPGRGTEWVDMLVNALGAAAGARLRSTE